jgi:hypothetical protein
MLIILAYRLPRAHADEVLRTITAYPLTQEFSDAWAKLPAGRNRRQPRYPHRRWPSVTCRPRDLVRRADRGV